MTRRVSYVAAVAVALASIRPAHAQETVEAPAALAPGKHAFSFDIPQSGGAAIAGWANLTARTQLGLRLSGNLQRQHLDISDSTERNATFGDAHMGVELRRFLPRSATVAPFLSGSLSAGGGNERQDDSQVTLRTSYWDVGAGVGGGVEWFPLPSISVGGRLGLDFGYRHLHQGDDFGEGHQALGNVFFISTGTSSLALKIYF
jgi:hypothetical protein